MTDSVVMNVKKKRINTNRKYWVPKIEKNIERDKINAHMASLRRFDIPHSYL